jgi:hypothetical protein
MKSAYLQLSTKNSLMPMTLILPRKMEAALKEAWIFSKRDWKRCQSILPPFNPYIRHMFSLNNPFEWMMIPARLCQLFLLITFQSTLLGIVDGLQHALRLLRRCRLCE